MGRKRLPRLLLCSMLFAWSAAGYSEELDGKGHGPTVKLPAKILSGYSRYGLIADSVPYLIENMLDPMRKAGFTTVDLKIQPSDFDLADPRQLHRLKELSEAVRVRELTLLTYVYPSPPSGLRDPQKDADLPPFVRSDGKVLEHRFSLIHWPSWRKFFDNAFQLARVSRELGIAAVRLDIEPLITDINSYDDIAWRSFASEHHLNPVIPAAERFKTLQAKNLTTAYEQWMQARLDDVAKRFEREMHAINPDLALGIMPCQGAMTESFIKYLATDRAPAIMDCWSMYNGQGYTKAVSTDQARIKSANPHNLYIPWFRINNYRPGDIPIQAYYAAKATDGYSNWVMSMVSKDAQNHQSGMYALPDKFSPEDYFLAYRQANQWIRSDLARGIKGTPSVAFKPPTPLAPALKLNIPFPDLKPVGSGEGEPTWVALRNQATVYVYVKAGEVLDIDVAHLAGAARMMSLHYIVLDKNRNPVNEGTVLPGGKVKISISTLKAGLYAIVISGGESGMAWYGVRVNNRHMAIPAKGETVFFYLGKPINLYLTRTSPAGAARVTASTGGVQIIAARLNDGPVIIGQKATFDLPAQQLVSVIVLDKPAVMPAGAYTQDPYLTTDGDVSPYVSDGPERRLQ